MTDPTKEATRAQLGHQDNDSADRRRDTDGDLVNGFHANFAVWKEHFQISFGNIMKKLDDGGAGLKIEVFAFLFLKIGCFFEFDIYGDTIVIGEFKRFLPEAEKLEQGFFLDGFTTSKKKSRLQKSSKSTSRRI